MKYIMLKRKIGDMEQLIPIIFPNILVHQHVAQAIKNLPGNPYGIENKVHSAGEISFNAVECFGSSSALNISAKDTDADTIFLHGYEQGINAIK